MRLTRRYRAGLAVAALLACSDPTRACTLIGCASGLVVELAELPTTAFRVEARSASNVVYVFDCPDVTRCGRQVLLADYLPEVATITVTTAGRSRSYEVRPEYRVSYPNGRSCSPECRQATVRLQLP